MRIVDYDDKVVINLWLSWFMVSLFAVLFGELAVGHLAPLCRCLWYPLGLVREMIPGMSSTPLPQHDLLHFSTCF